MKYHAFRLTYGTDLRQGIETYCKDNDIKAGCIVTCVGCVYKASFRSADGKTVINYDGRYEIVSLTGTLSSNGVHFHISLSDEAGNVRGGHLTYGTMVNTTAEIVLLSLDEEYDFKREYDQTTGYNEIIIRDKNRDL
ncbi:MAG: DNA-binding protein [Erysipelotrichaceae bacterium]|nr:DNA-binding protein [Erysipelotrichaceae bacterium]